MTPEEHLLKAAEDMAEHGQAKESFFAPGQRWETAAACAIGSIARSGNLTRDGGIVKEGACGSPAVRLLARQIRLEHPAYDIHDDYQAVTLYNDADSTSAEDMILTMKRASQHG